MGTARVEQALAAVERVGAAASTPDDLLESLSGELHRLVPHDGAGWFAVDPVTLLASAPSRVEGLDAGMCDVFWHLEFHEQDTGLFHDLAQGAGAAALRLSLDDRPARSARYRDFMQPQGYDDELRGVFQTGDNTWGFVDLYRDASHPPFDADDVAVVKSISGAIAAGLRSHAREASPWLGQPSAPGLLVIDRSGRAVSANEEAHSWLRELWPMAPTPATELDSLNLFEMRDIDLGVPTALFALVARARAVGEGRERAPSRIRLRDRRGRWLVLHASPLTGPGTNEGGSVALVIEAAKSAEIAPIIIEAYSLTSRERDVLGAIARGSSTAEIAAELFLSPHTVRDYIKTVFDKLGVSSRGELVARLFAEHYSDPLHASMVHAD